MAEENVSPISAAKPPVSKVLEPASEQAATIRLKPVIRKPGMPGARPSSLLHGPASGSPAAPAPAASAPSAPSPAAANASVDDSMAKLHTITQKLKGVTQEIPQQAILHKTGIIADQKLTDAQKEASKSRTARISLSDALGAAPVQNEAAPMKTIRIRRPENLARPAGAAAAAPSTAKPAPAAAPADNLPPVADAAESPTQRKTIKIARPKLSIKTKKSVPVPPQESGENAVDDIPDLPDVPDLPSSTAPSGETVKDVPGWLLVCSTLFQGAACLAMGVLIWMLYADWSVRWF